MGLRPTSRLLVCIRQACLLLHLGLFCAGWILAQDKSLRLRRVGLGIGVQNFLGFDAKCCTTIWDSVVECGGQHRCGD